MKIIIENEKREDVWYVDEMSDEQDGEGFNGEYGVFHIDTGFCKNHFGTRESAQEYADELNEDRRNMKRRSTIQKQITSKKTKIFSLINEMLELQIEDYKLCDKKQRFEEKEEKILVCGRPKKYENHLIGRVYWTDYFKDDDTGESIGIERNMEVCRNGVWDLPKELTFKL